jgi:deoxyribodipyrimidine photo-lyase
MKDTAIVWFRNDLRLHDNEAIVKAVQGSDNVIPAYIFDERIFGSKTKFGFPKTGKYRAKFILDSVINLRKNLQAIGSDLYVRIGKPEDEIASLASHYKASWVFCNRERTDEEEKVQDKLEKNLWDAGLELIYTRGKMLYYTADLPFPVKHTPDVFTNFRKEVEKYILIREPLDSPTEIKNEFHDTIEWGSMPTLDQLGHKDFINDTKFIGGEDAALAQLNYYLWETNLIKNYKETRNELLGWDFSSKFSAWLAIGALSPKLIYAEVKKYEAQHGSNESTYWVIFELLWRDFFRLVGKKYGNKIFQQNGIREINTSTETDQVKFQKWASGNTGIPFIDANMRELNATGFMSNRGRQNVASFLVNDLKLNWLLGAEYFESLLLDYDPCSNYGNWNYLAGIGNDPREDRYFNILSQSRRYDPTGKFIRHWVPELGQLSNDYIHNIDRLSEKELTAANIKIGIDYPKSMVKLKDNN